MQFSGTLCDLKDTIINLILYSIYLLALCQCMLIDTPKDTHNDNSMYVF